MTHLWFVLLSFAINLQTIAGAAQVPGAALSGIPAQAQPSSPAGPGPVFEQTVEVGRTALLDMPVNIRRIALANPDLAESTVVDPREVMINGKKAGTTSLVLWLADGSRLVYTVRVKPDDTRIQAVRQEIEHALPGQHVELVYENDSVFLRGTAANLIDADRALSIAGTIGPVVNLLNITLPPAQQQILLKVRFADVDRTVSTNLGANIFSTGAGNTPGAISTGQFSPPAVGVNPTTVSLSNALNLLIFRPDLNIGATIEALESRSLLEILAEPNVLAIDGKPASFLSGGEFPYPTLQGGGAGLGAVTIEFREFGVRINFLPRITPRGTIRLQLAPEVSSLDFANGLVFQGFTIPALNTRRVQTEVELRDGQSFAIAGLLNNQVTDSLSKIPGLGDIPLLGKIFQSRSRSKTNSELLIIITPEIVNPMPAGATLPELQMPESFVPGTLKSSPRTPGMDKTGATLPVSGAAIPYEQLVRDQKVTQGPPQNGNGQPVLQFVPMLTAPGATTDTSGSAPPPKTQ